MSRLQCCFYQNYILVCYEDDECSLILFSEGIIAFSSSVSLHTPLSMEGHETFSWYAITVYGLDSIIGICVAALPKILQPHGSNEMSLVGPFCYFPFYTVSETSAS